MRRDRRSAMTVIPATTGRGELFAATRARFAGEVSEQADVSSGATAGSGLLSAAAVASLGASRAAASALRCVSSGSSKTVGAGASVLAVVAAGTSESLGHGASCGSRTPRALRPADASVDSSRLGARPVEIGEAGARQLIEIVQNEIGHLGPVRGRDVFRIRMRLPFLRSVGVAGRSGVAGTTWTM